MITHRGTLPGPVSYTHLDVYKRQVYTQQSLSDEFRKVAGDYAALYTSKVEVGYSPYLYINHPYWDTDEFKKGAVCYGGLVYTCLLYTSAP